MVPHVMKVLRRQESVLKQRSERRFDIEGVGSREANQARVARDEVVGGFEIGGEDGGERGGGWREGVGWFEE